MKKEDFHIKKQYVEVPNRSYKKSLDAFKAGLHASTKKKSTRRFWLPLSVTGTAIVIAGMLSFSFIPFLHTSSTHSDHNEVTPPEPTSNAFVLEEIDEEPTFIEEVMERPEFVWDETIAKPFHHNEFMLPLKRGWKISEEKMDIGTKTTITGPKTEEITLLVFEDGTSKSEIEEKSSQFLVDYSYTEATTLPTNKLDQYFQQMDMSYPMEIREFPIAIEKSSVYAMKNKENNRFYDLHVTELYGKPMLYFGDFPLDKPETQTITFFLLSKIGPNETPYIIKEDQQHSPSGQPLKKEALIEISLAHEYMRMTFSLYENEELGITTYVPEGAVVQKIDYNTFTEWRFQDEETNEGNFYSVGKMDPGFDINHAQDVLLAGYGVDRQYLEDPDGITTNMYFGYYIGEQEVNKQGIFNMHEVDGTWYYTYVQKDYLEPVEGNNHNYEKVKMIEQGMR